LDVSTKEDAYRYEFTVNGKVKYVYWDNEYFGDCQLIWGEVGFAKEKVGGDWRTRTGSINPGDTARPAHFWPSFGRPIDAVRWVKYWTDRGVMTGSHLNPWFNRSRECPGEDPFALTDSPKFTSSAEEFEHEIRFEIFLISAPGCPCAKNALALYFRTTLSKAAGQDAEASLEKSSHNEFWEGVRTR
jgi:hypothetical protein